MKDTVKKCFNCQNFDYYYFKGLKRFNKSEYGWCTQECDTVKCNEVCEKFTYKHRSYKSNRMLKLALNDVLTELSEIRKQLELKDNDK